MSERELRASDYVAHVLEAIDRIRDYTGKLSEAEVFSASAGLSPAAEAVARWKSEYHSAQAPSLEAQQQKAVKDWLQYRESQGIDGADGRIEGSDRELQGSADGESKGSPDLGIEDDLVDL
jgi:hypothetical protein